MSEKSYKAKGNTKLGAATGATGTKKQPVKDPAGKPKKGQKAPASKSKPKTEGQDKRKKTNAAGQRPTARTQKPSSAGKRPSHKAQTKEKQSQKTRQTPAAAASLHTLAAKQLEFVSYKDAIAVANYDLQWARVSTDKRYPYKNGVQYYTAINTWCHLVNDICVRCGLPPRGLRLMEYIKQHGLVAAIRDCKHAAGFVVRGEEVPPAFAFLTRGMTREDVLQVLRFCKRFTPVSGDLLEKTALANWKQVENQVKMWSRCDLTDPLSCKAQIAENLRQILWELHDEVYEGSMMPYTPLWYPNTGFRVNPERLPDDLFEDWAPPTGASFERLSNGERIRQVAATLRLKGTTQYLLGSANERDGRREVYQTGPEARTTVFGGRELTHRVQQRTYRRLRNMDRLILVPKDVDKPRVVCPEQLLPQIVQRHIAKALKGFLALVGATTSHGHVQVPWDSDAANGALAARRDLATLDLSHASDSQAAVLVEYVYQDFEFIDELRNWRPTATVLPDGTTHTLHQHGPMGTGDTWIAMSGLLLSACILALEWAGVPTDRRVASVFGDDIVVNNEAVPTLIDILSMLGFVVNQDKSYWGEAKYRESCGYEWWFDDASDRPQTLDLRSHYYPRFPVAADEKGVFHNDTRWDYDRITSQATPKDTLSRFTALQRHLYEDGYEGAATFLSALVKSLEPRMTTSLVGSECDDLYGPFEIARVEDRRNTLASAGARIPTIIDDWGREVPATTRRGHLVPKVTHAREGGPRNPVLEEWDYVRFLERGHHEGDPVFQQLAAWNGIQLYSAPMERTREDNTPTIIWVYQW